MAALFNLTGALFGGAVASTIGKGFGGHKCGDDDDGAVRAHRCVCLEYRDLVGGIALEFQSRAHRRTLRCGDRQRTWQMVGVEMGRRALAKGGAADAHVADCRFYSRRADHVFAFCFAAPFWPQNGEFPFRAAPNF